MPNSTQELPWSWYSRLDLPSPHTQQTMLTMVKQPGDVFHEVWATGDNGLWTTCREVGPGLPICVYTKTSTYISTYYGVQTRSRYPLIASGPHEGVLRLWLEGDEISKSFFNWAKGEIPLSLAKTIWQEQILGQFTYDLLANWPRQDQLFLLDMLKVPDFSGILSPLSMWQQALILAEGERWKNLPRTIRLRFLHSISLGIARMWAGWDK